MIDSFSSAYASARDFLRRRWLWVVGALVLYFFFGNWVASFLGYTETVIEHGKPIAKETTFWLSPGARLLRDLLIGIAVVFGIAAAIRRNIAFNRQLKAAREQANIANLQAQRERDRIAGEQFSNAVKLLAQKDAENKPDIDARISGIYSLQTLANNRVAEYGAQVVKTLTTYIKQTAQLTAQPPLKENETLKEARTLGKDVKIAFNVLEQLLDDHKKDSAKPDKPLTGIELSYPDLNFSGQDFSWLDLSAGQIGGLSHYSWSWCNLQNADLSEAQLQGAYLEGAQLQGANLWDTQLQGAGLWKAQMQGAKLLRTRLQGAKLSGAQLQGVDLVAELQGADLERAQLQGANLWDTQLQGANLAKAQLQGANLWDTQLQGANLAKAQLQYADLSKTKLNDKTILPSNLSGQIWHSRQPELSGIDSLSPDAEWDLDPFLRSGYALVGVLSNFSGWRSALTSKGVIRARKLRIAARKLLDEKKLPEDFPQDWRDWLSEIKSDGSHPNDSGRLG